MISCLLIAIYFYFSSLRLCLSLTNRISENLDTESISTGKNSSSEENSTKLTAQISPTIFRKEEFMFCGITLKNPLKPSEAKPRHDDVITLTSDGESASSLQLIPVPLFSGFFDIAKLHYNRIINISSASLEPNVMSALLYLAGFPASNHNT